MAGSAATSRRRAAWPSSAAPEDLGPAMAAPGRGLGIFLSRVLFCIITPPLLVPAIAGMRITRFLVAFCFGRLYGGAYDRIIASFGGAYGRPMAEGLSRVAGEAADSEVALTLDCGTGTGFASALAAEAFPGTAVAALDLLPRMLHQARSAGGGLSNRVFHVQGDAFALPFADGAFDLVLAQNTLPCFPEMFRVCRPGGWMIYVDSSAGWIAGLATRLVARQGLFERVEGGKAGLGFFVLARRGSSPPPDRAIDRGPAPGKITS